MQGDWHDDLYMQSGVSDAQVTLQFPAVLERLSLPAFDLCKLVGPFVRHEPTLPRELKRHLFSIEERVRA